MGHSFTPLPDGSTTLTDTANGQAMHSRVGSWQEANQVYVGPSGLTQRQDPAILWDVGMGTASNALAALEGSTCLLEIWSFENDLNGIRTALGRTDLFPWLNRHSNLVQELLERGVVHLPGGRGRWHLLEGDFRREISRAPGPDFVFWDFYSPGVVPDLWSLEIFQDLAQRLSPESLWISYAAATSVRAALLLSGFHVGRGASTRAKSETTVASLSRNRVTQPLGKEWLGKIERSSRLMPHGYSGTREDLRAQLVRTNHFSVY